MCDKESVEHVHGVAITAISRMNTRILLGCILPTCVIVNLKSNGKTVHKINKINRLIYCLAIIKSTATVLTNIRP